MYCPSAFESAPPFPRFFEFPTTETGPFNPLTSSFVQIFLVFLTSAGARAFASGGWPGEVAGAGLALWGEWRAGFPAKHREPPSAPQKAKALQYLNDRVIKPPIPSRAGAGPSTLNPVYRTKFQGLAT